MSGYYPLQTYYRNIDESPTRDDFYKRIGGREIFFDGTDHHFTWIYLASDMVTNHGYSMFDWDDAFNEVIRAREAGVPTRDCEFPAPEQMLDRFCGRNGGTENMCDICVGKPLEVTEEHGRPLGFGQAGNRLRYVMGTLVRDGSAFGSTKFGTGWCRHVVVVEADRAA